ncbi:MAG: 16S rRNA (adenine(1518)-N(6)/adenine(1519)-N(6))-dimethyltransferase RsmA [Candidatus Helarchaeota archaeon]
MSIYDKSKKGDLLKETKSILKKYNIYPNKKLSQSFLINSNLIKWHLEFAELSPDDQVLEIGAGIGTLTLSIAKKVKKVIAVELDNILIQVLKDRLTGFNNIEIVHSDVLNLKNSIFEDKKVISNLPYKISSPMVFKLFETKYKFALLTLQKEFADRLIAKPNSKSYGKISVTSYYYSNIEILKEVPNTYFYPVPKVDSALVKIIPKIKKIEVQNLKFHYELINALFSQKNKILEKVLKKFLLRKFDINKNHDIFTRIPYLRRRIRELSPEMVLELSNLLNKMKIGQDLI